MSTNVLGRGRVRVGVLRGGPSSEYEISLKSGQTVLKHLPENYVPLDIFISRDGEWHLGGISKSPDRILRNIDVAFNALHGKYGEDGGVQKLLERFGIPFTGSSSLSSSMGMNKVFSKKQFTSAGIKTPHATVFYPKDHVRKKVAELFRTFPQPSIIKPIAGGSSLGVTVAKNFSSFEEGIENALMHGGIALIEEYIPGREATVSVLESVEDGSLYSLFPVEIRKPFGKDVFDFESKYVLSAEKICPSTFSEEEKFAIQNTAIKAHRALGLRHYSNTDFILNPERGIYVLEVNSQPGMTESSILPKSLEKAGISIPEFLHHTILLALKKR